ncbi:MAG: hypothetical protein HDS68_05705 [Bacteroidales bacterium]|nr:hypothetical protein [Bacteroidales bacterium]
MVKQILKLWTVPCVACAMLAVGTGSISAAPAGTAKGAHDMEHPFKFAYKAKPSKMARSLEEFRAALKDQNVRKGAPDLDYTLDAEQLVSYIDGPDGQTWFYTSKIDEDKVFHPYDENNPNGGGWSEEFVKGFEFTIYNENFETIGTVKSEFTLQENESKVFQVALGDVVTKNFFNSDDKYEIMVYSARNFDGMYGASQRTDVYSIGGAKEENGNDKLLASYEGYCIDAVNVPKNRFSENFYITFAKDYSPEVDDYDDPIEYANSCGMTLQIYKRGGMSDPILISERVMCYNNLPGDQENYPYVFTIAGGMDKDGYNVPLFVFVEYEKPFWVNPLGFDFITGEPADESQTPDNNLKISVLSLADVSDKSLTEVSTTLIPIENDNNDYCTYYGIGMLDWTGDIAVNPETHSPERFTVCVLSDKTGKEDYAQAYKNYDVEGRLLNTIAEEVDAVMMLSDINGKNGQAVFTYLQDNKYYFSIVDIVTGEEVFALPQDFEGYMLKFNMDRVVLDGKILYAFETSQVVNDDQFNTILQIVWVDEEGKLDHVGNYNLGQDIAYAQCYIEQSALDPYLFDADDEVELMFLIKRYIGVASEIREELGIIGDKNGTMFSAIPDAEKGSLRTIALLNLDVNPSLMISWIHADDSYSADFYSLPFERFLGGDGSVENPYQIGSFSQLKLIAGEPAAHYLIVRDFNASGHEIKSIPNFKGSLDGGNHCITGLTIDPSTSSWAGLFDHTIASGTATEGAIVKNLILLNPSLKVAANHSRAGIIAGEGMHLTIDNVHVYNASIEVDKDFDGSLGVLVGKLTNKSEIRNSFVSGTSVEATGADALGGMVGTILTGSSVKASAFSGALTGKEYVGGIVGDLTKDGSVTDCHVEADITAQNTVGGIVGYCERGHVNRNVVEGTITATQASRWEKVLAAGGIVGYLTNDLSETAALEGSTVDSTPVVTNNIVALQSITAPAGGTVHRVVGKSSEELAANAYEDEVPKTEAGLENNYVHDHLAVIAADGSDLHTSLEGASVDKYDTDIEFFENLGYVFGESLDQPWRQNGMFVALHFESSISILPAEMTVAEEETFFVNVAVHSRDAVTEEDLLSDFSFNTDEQILEMTGNYTFDNNVFAIEFKAIKEGSAPVTISTLGSTATCTVTVEPKSGIGNVAAETAATLTFDGASVNCPDALIDLYSVSGMKVASGVGSVAVGGLPSGIYVAVTNGGKLKIAVK